VVVACSGSNEPDANQGQAGSAGSGAGAGAAGRGSGANGGSLAGSSGASGSAGSNAQGGAGGTAGSATSGGSGGGGSGASTGATGGVEDVGGAAGTDGGESAGGTAGEAPAGAAGQAGGGGESGDGGGESVVCQPDCDSNKWPCWPMPNLIGSGLPNEASYTDLGETIRDDVTCLEWQKIEPADLVEWPDARDYCEDLTLGGHLDWRLPTRIESISIRDFTAASGIGAGPFPEPASPSMRWTGSLVASSIEQMGTSNSVWVMAVMGTTFFQDSSNMARARCVRGGSGERTNQLAVPPPNQYSEVAPGEIRDNYTGLIWQAEDDAGPLAFSDALAHCASLELGGESWRVPSARELSTLVDEADDRWAINHELFPDTTTGALGLNFWSSDLDPERASAVLAVQFNNGTVTLSEAGSTVYFSEAYVKCVR
jgi:hypothetical protein